MKKFLKTLGWIFVAGFIAIQFIRPEKNISKGDQPNSISKTFEIPADVKSILDKACMDCHSNNTVYPWYNNIQPVAWWLADHVKEGKGHLNFDEYTNKRPRFQYRKMEETIDMVKEEEMPLDSYTWTHRDAILTNEERVKLTDWANGVMEKLKTIYPIDSLVRKRPS